jgi:hypothetical protein
MKFWARNIAFVSSALILSVASIYARAGITGSDPRPPKTSVVVAQPDTSTMVAGITGSDPRPPKTSVVVAGITGSDPRPPKTSRTA